MWSRHHADVNPTDVGIDTPTNVNPNGCGSTITPLDFNPNRYSRDTHHFNPNRCGCKSCPPVSANTATRHDQHQYGYWNTDSDENEYTYTIANKNTNFDPFPIANIRN
jgi:hypothetical protein